VDDLRGRAIVAPALRLGLAADRAGRHVIPLTGIANAQNLPAASCASFVLSTGW
jgi:hypothetical protein